MEAQSSHACPAVVRSPSSFMSEEGLLSGKAILLPPHRPRLCLPSPAEWGQEEPAKTKVNVETTISSSRQVIHIFLGKHQEHGRTQQHSQPRGPALLYTGHVKQQKQNMHSCQVPMKHTSKKTICWTINQNEINSEGSKLYRMHLTATVQSK